MMRDRGEISKNCQYNVGVGGSESAIRKFQRRVNINTIDEILASNLIDMHAFSKDNNGIKYLLTVIDIISIFVCIVPLKRKTGQEVANAFSRIL